MPGEGEMTLGKELRDVGGKRGMELLQGEGELLMAE